MKIPQQYLPVMPYLIIKDSRRFLEFAKAVFNASEQMIVPAGDGDTRGIIHGEIRIGDAVIMFADANENWTERTSGMFLYVPNVDVVWEAAKSQGVKELAPPTKQEYGYSAGFDDPFGNQWWIAEPSE